MHALRDNFKNIIVAIHLAPKGKPLYNGQNDAAARFSQQK